MPSSNDTASGTPNSPVRFQPGLPTLLSVLVPGLGQFYLGRRFAGVLWLLAATVGYVPFILPGVVIHLLAIATSCFRTPEDLPKYDKAD